ncbi:hypothetical protein ACJ73_02646 [Blastomyces percursus]|uniref:Uncharacterized protein n=1 Tax=Blastomyces percursus TaxID=1658174 RepID=A0A1J9QAW1_9EURO|nr:hypothetical protein ACJ73_02646 [Blastomyces percursus]
MKASKILTNSPQFDCLDASGLGALQLSIVSDSQYVFNLLGYILPFSTMVVYISTGVSLSTSQRMRTRFLQIMGSSTRYRFEIKNSNVHKSATLLEIIHLCNVDSSKISVIKDAAENAVIHNEYPGYNCQDYVLELLADLEAKDIIDKNEMNYNHNKWTVRDKQEGLV